MFTIETASQAGKNGVKAKRERKRLAAELPLITDYYVQKRLARVRKQIDMLSDLMDAETNPQAVDRYSAAIDRLSKLEGYLANRPGPGNRKPAPERTTKRQFTPTPQPVVPEQPRANDPLEPNG